MPDLWPELPYEKWAETCATLQRWTQIVGKTRLALTPWLNHSWHVTLRVTARGLGTPLISTGVQDFQIEFDFIDHVLWLRMSDGRNGYLKLRPISVAEFHAEFLAMLSALDIKARISGVPNELPDAIPFASDTVQRPYDPEYAARFWRILLRAHEVFAYFRTAFLGKVSPVHFFWGSFDLAVTRFSGRSAPLHPGGIPHLPDTVVREAYSHEVSSAGFWPGGGAIAYPAFYSYAYPAPAGFASARIEPGEAFFSTELGEFLLPYDAVRLSGDSKKTLLAFLESTYVAAADLGRWNRAQLDCAPGLLRHPRDVP